MGLDPSAHCTWPPRSSVVENCGMSSKQLSHRMCLCSPGHREPHIPLEYCPQHRQNPGPGHSHGHLPVWHTPAQRLSFLGDASLGEVAPSSPQFQSVEHRCLHFQRGVCGLSPAARRLGSEQLGGWPRVHGMQYTGSSYLVGAVVIPLPLVKHVVACGSILVALVLLPEPLGSPASW